MSGDDMVAVVRGLETGLAITVIDGNKRYTLAPTRVQNYDKIQEVRTSSTEPATVCCESTAQAVDGRYTSTYQVQHCKMTPTSPPVLTTEFPPQRSTLCPGQGNFEVGGSGSGETYVVSTKTNKFRGAMNWPDRSAVCSPRAFHEVNVFASSLRKYPAVSPDKSSEIVEKTVNYAVEKNGLKNQQPTRLIESDKIDPRTPHKAGLNTFTSRKLDALPTKLMKVDYNCKEFKFPKEYDIRFLRNLSKRARESARNACANSATHANSENQAAVKMVSREVSTDPRPQPTRRTIAVSVTISSSTTQSEYQCPSRTESLEHLELTLDYPKLVQTVSSCVDLNKRNLSVENLVRIKSEENVASNNSNPLKKDTTGQVKDGAIVSVDSKDNNQTAQRNPSEFFKRINLELCKKIIRILECDIVDVLTYFIGCLKNGEDGRVTDEMKYILKECDKLTDKQADDATHVLVNDLKDVLRTPKNSNDCVALTSSVHAKNNTIQLTESGSTLIRENKSNNSDDYTQVISQEIEEWLENLNKHNTQDTGFKQDIKKRLTLDIIDKYKYLESKPSTTTPDSNEIERLKFEIYKCMNKLVGESYSEILQHAEDLLAKIRCLPLVTSVPRKCSLQYDNTIFSNFKSISTHSCMTRSEEADSKEYTGHPKQYNNTLLRGKGRETTNKETEISNCKPRKSPRRKWNNLDTLKPRQYKKASWFLSAPRILSNNWPCQFTSIQKSSWMDFSQKHIVFRADHKQSRNSRYDKSQSNFAPSIRELNEEYDDFIKEWVEKIPIVVTNAEDQKLAELARLGIFNGIWKAITKLNLDPNAHNNSYYYQDVLDDEIEDLLSNLPQTAELVANKHGLKAQLLEKTRIMNENIKAIILPSCFKQQLMECLDNNLPKISIFDPLKEITNVYKMSIIEDYILLIRFIDEDNVKSNMYKNSLLQKIMELADITKKNQRVKDSNSLKYVSEFVNALSNVPIPDRKNLEDEANEILLGNEVTGWLSALPLCNNLDIVEIRRYRNKLVKKIVEIEKQQNLSEFPAQVNLREDIRRQLKTISLQANDMKLVMEELFKRLKEIPKIQDATNRHQRESDNYEDFRRSVPGCSTFMPFPEASEEGSSYIVVGGDIVKHVVPKYLKPFKESRISEEDWISMELTKRPSKLAWSQTQVTRPNKQTREQPHTSQRYDQTVLGQNPVNTNFPREFSDFPDQTLHQPYEYSKNITPWNDIVKQSYKQDPLPQIPPSRSYVQPIKQEKQLSRHESLSYSPPLNIYEDNLRGHIIKNSPVFYPHDEGVHMSRDKTVIDNADVRRFILDKTTPRTSIKSSPVNSILPARLPPENSYMDISIKREKQSAVGVNNDVFSDNVPRSSGVRQNPKQQQIVNDNKQSRNPNLSWFRTRNGNEDNQEKLPSWNTNTITPYPNNNRNDDISDSNYPVENFENPAPSYTDQPIGFSTPLQPIIQEQPFRPRKRYQARVDSLRTNNVKRKLKMEDSDYDSDNEEELSCFCSRSHRGDKSCIRVVPSCEDLYLDIPHCVSDRMISCPHFY